MKRAAIRQGLLTLISMLVGFAFVTQIRTYDRITGDVRNLSSEELSILIINLIDENARIESEIAQINQQNAFYARTQSDGSSMLNQLVSDLNQLRGLTGAAQVQGPGVRIVVNYALRAADVMALLNEIRNAGAEAISINNQRITAHTSIEEINGMLLINDTPQAPPYEIAVLGDSNTLMGALNRIGGLIRIWDEIDGVSITIEPSELLTIPRDAAPLQFRFAQPAP
jgi:uncharacterized protein YlxW (UPF0749 family)